MRKLIKIQPLFNRIITTMNAYEDDVVENGVIASGKTKGSLKEYQTVIAVGDMVKTIKVGDEVCINPTRYQVMQHKDKSLKNGVIGDNMMVGYKFHTITLGDKECLVLYDSDIEFIVLEAEDVQESKIIIEKPQIITQ